MPRVGKKARGRQQSESVRDSTGTQTRLFDLLQPSYVLVSPIRAILGLDFFPSLAPANQGGQVQMIAARNIYVSAFQGHMRNKLMHDVPGTASEGKSNGEILRLAKFQYSGMGGSRGRSFCS